MAPAKVPRPILERLAKEMEQITALPEVRDKMIAMGLTPKAVVLHDFDNYIQSEVDKLGRLVKVSGAKAE